MLKIAICDDDEVSLSFLGHILRNYSNESGTPMLIDTFLRGDELLKAHVHKHYNILILDIMMPDMNGIKLAKELRKKDDEAFLIFLTSSDEYTKAAYQVDAIHYLMKPVKPIKLLTIIHKIMRFLPEEEEHFILVPTKEGIVKLINQDIVYVEHINHVIYFHKADGSEIASLTSTLTLGEVASTLMESSNFFQPHRAYIVNMNYIQQLTKTDLVLKNNQVIPIPSRRYVAVRNQYTEYMGMV